MTAVFDAAAAGVSANGPASSLTEPWAHVSGVTSGVIFAGFAYDTTSLNSRSIHRVVTYGGQPMTKLVQKPKGYWPGIKGAPGYTELWAAVVTAANSKTISVGLSYVDDVGNPFAPTSAAFSNFRGSSVSYGGETQWGSVADWASANKWISIPVSAFMNTLTVGVISSDGVIGNDFNQTTRFRSADNTLLIGEADGPGAFKVQSKGGPWAAATVNIRPVNYLAANRGNGIIW